MHTILVSSTAPSGAHIVTRHYSPELAAIEIISRMAAGHTDIGDSVAAPGEAVYAVLGTTTATIERRAKAAKQTEAVRV